MPTSHPDAPVGAGDRLLLHPSVTGLGELAWAVVDFVQHVAEPGDLPWNAGPGFPYRVGFHLRFPEDDGRSSTRLGVVWMNSAGSDPVVGVRRIARA
ncbi:MAG TPA: hypothetical protein VN241_00865 [Microbacterium sp.]|nr:hypothetical protein [Microbacterium sp.]